MFPIVPLHDMLPTSFCYIVFVLPLYDLALCSIISILIIDIRPCPLPIPFSAPRDA